MNRLSWIEVESFRGFAETCRISLDADAVVITGPNGVGKTSLIDAITWVLTGQVPRLEQHKERRTDDVLTNRYRSGTDPRVTLGLSIDGDDLIITRNGRAPDAPTVERREGVSHGSDAVAEALGFQTRRELEYAIATWGCSTKIRCVPYWKQDRMNSRRGCATSSGSAS